MWMKIKLAILGLGALAISILWALLGREKSKHNETKVKLDTAEDDIEQQRQTIEAENEAKAIKHGVNTSTDDDINKRLSEYYRD